MECLLGAQYVSIGAQVMLTDSSLVIACTDGAAHRLSIMFLLFMSANLLASLLIRPKERIVYIVLGERL